MDVLVTLCQQANTIISADELLERCWGGAIHGDNPVHKVIAQIRRLLGDSSTASQYIETIRKRGYRTIAPVQFDYSRKAQAGTWLNESPFRGLQAFDEKHAAVFFGRSDATFKLRQIIENQIQAANSSEHSNANLAELILVLGPSGSGKTSLIRAGLLPILSHQSTTLQLISSASFDLAEKGEHSLLTTLGGLVLDLEVAQKMVFTNHSATSLGQLLENNIDQAITILQQSLTHCKPSPTPRHAIFIDRFEAIFNSEQIAIDERNHFLHILEQLARSQSCLVLLASRNDFYPQIAACPILMAAAHFDVNSPSQAEMAQMIRLPALAANLSFALNPQSHLKLDEVLCESANGNPDALPLLQYTLHELYRLRSPERVLTFEALQQLGGIEGGIEGVIGRRAEQVINTLSESQRHCLPHVLSLVCTIASSQAALTSRRAPWSSLHGEDERVVVNALVQSRLFVSEMVDGAPGFGVAHEALLRRWPRVVEWIGTHRHALQIRGRIGDLATRWQQASHNADLLIPEGSQLDEACDLLNLTQFSLSHQEQALIKASTARTHWRKRLRLAVLCTILVLALLAVGLGLSALSAKRQAQQRQFEAEGLIGFMLKDIADKLHPLARLDLLDDIDTKALNYFTWTSDENLSQAALIRRVQTLQTLADVQYKRGKPDSAIQALQSSNLILLKLLRKMPDSRDALKNLAANALRLGQIQSDKHNWQQAESFFVQYRDYNERLHQLEPANENAKKRP